MYSFSTQNLCKLFPGYVQFPSSFSWRIHILLWLAMAFSTSNSSPELIMSTNIHSRVQWMNEHTRVHPLLLFSHSWLITLEMLNKTRKTWVNPPHLNWPQQLRLINTTAEHPEAPRLTWRMETEGSPGSDFTLLLLVAPMPNSFFCSCNKNFSYGSSSLE